jgi:hypothetical protein
MASSALDPSYDDYLRDVVGVEGEALDLTQAVENKNSYAARDEKQAAPHSPLRRQRQQQHSKSDDAADALHRDDDASQRGLLSPFSPSLQKFKRKRPSKLQWENFPSATCTTGTDLSLAPCRKVSVVVLVSQPPPSKQEHRLCLFPLNFEADETCNDNGEYEQPRTPPATPLCPTFEVPAASSKDLIVVNPTAFGKYIPSTITMETAKAVARIAHIASEDWTRSYRFQHVSWSADNDGDDTVLNMCRAAVNDAMAAGSISSRNIIALGEADSKTQTLFGDLSMQSVARVFAQPATNDMAPSDVLQRHGLLGWTVQAILDQLSADETCTLSVLEIADDDLLHDLLSSRPFTHDASKRVVLQATAAGGALLLNMSHVPLDSLKSMGHLMRRAMAAAYHKDRKKARGTILATVKIWPTPGAGQRSDKYTAIQFVDLASANSQNSGTTTVSWKKRNAALRKSVWALGGLLRATLLKEAGNEATISYRDSMLTRVLQRSMDQPDARTVVLASVSPLSDAYEETMATLRYVHRLIYRPGQAPQSPYEPHSKSASPTSPSSTSPMSTLVDLPAMDDASTFLQQMVSDPRQRLAKIFHPSRRKESPAAPWPIEDTYYVPTRYMNVDPASIRFSERARRQSHILSRKTAVALDHENFDRQLDDTLSRTSSVAEEVEEEVNYPAAYFDRRDERTRGIPAAEGDTARVPGEEQAINDSGSRGPNESYAAYFNQHLDELSSTGSAPEGQQGKSYSSFHSSQLDELSRDNSFYEEQNTTEYTTFSERENDGSSTVFVQGQQNELGTAPLDQPDELMRSHGRQGQHNEGYSSSHVVREDKASSRNSLPGLQHESHAGNFVDPKVECSETHNRQEPVDDDLRYSDFVRGDGKLRMGLLERQKAQDIAQDQQSRMNRGQELGSVDGASARGPEDNGHRLNLQGESFKAHGRQDRQSEIFAAKFAGDADQSRVKSPQERQKEPAAANLDSQARMSKTDVLAEEVASHFVPKDVRSRTNRSRDDMVEDDVARVAGENERPRSNIREDRRKEVPFTSRDQQDEQLRSSWAQGWPNEVETRRVSRHEERPGTNIVPTPYHLASGTNIQEQRNEPGTPQEYERSSTKILPVRENEAATVRLAQQGESLRNGYLQDRLIHGETDSFERVDQQSMTNGVHRRQMNEDASLVVRSRATNYQKKAPHIAREDEPQDNENEVTFGNLYQDFELIRAKVQVERQNEGDCRLVRVDMRPETSTLKTRLNGDDSSHVEQSRTANVQEPSSPDGAPRFPQDDEQARTSNRQGQAADDSAAHPFKKDDCQHYQNNAAAHQDRQDGGSHSISSREGRNEDYTTHSVQHDDVSRSSIRQDRERGVHVTHFDRTNKQSSHDEIWGVNSLQDTQGGGITSHQDKGFSRHKSVQEIQREDKSVHFDRENDLLKSIRPRQERNENDAAFSDRKHEHSITTEVELSREKDGSAKEDSSRADFPWKAEAVTPLPITQHLSTQRRHLPYFENLLQEADANEADGLSSELRPHGPSGESARLTFCLPQEVKDDLSQNLVQKSFPVDTSGIKAGALPGSSLPLSVASVPLSSLEVDDTTGRVARENGSTVFPDKLTEEELSVSAAGPCQTSFARRVFDCLAVTQAEDLSVQGQDSTTVGDLGEEERAAREGGDGRKNVSIRREKDDEIAALQRELEQSQIDRNEAVKIAEQAIGLQEELEQKATELEQELAIQMEQNVPIEDFERLQQSENDLVNELVHLQHEINMYKNEIATNDQELAELRTGFRNADTLCQRLVADNARYKNEIDDLMAQQAQILRSEAEFVAFERETERLRNERKAIQVRSEARETELLRELETKDEAIARLKQETNAVLDATVESKDRLVDELDWTRGELDKRLSDVRELSFNLKQVLSEKEEAVDRALRMEATLQSFQSETRAKLQKLLLDRREAKGLLESTLGENDALAQTIQELHASLETLRRERGESVGRQEESSSFLQRLEQENSDLRDSNREMKMSLDEYHAGARLSHVYEDTGHGVDRNYRRTSGSSVRQTPAWGGPRVLCSPDVRFVPGMLHRNADVRDHRAEEVAAYIAVSAKATMEQSHAETVRLKQQVYALEDSKDAEIAALRLQVRTLERLFDLERHR